jgi:hypothetical protein
MIGRRIPQLQAEVLRDFAPGVRFSRAEDKTMLSFNGQVRLEH